MMKKQRVVVAMSGGVDSSVAAALLKQQGFEVVGITMCLDLPRSRDGGVRCCGLQGIEDARAVARKLGIRHYVLNMGRQFKKRVIVNFCREYAAGRTPNPCVLCNQYLKFGVLLKHAVTLKAKLATGHYARMIRRGRACFLGRAKDKLKDQSYFLYRLGQNQLKHILFPLGNYTKSQVRDLASRFGLPTAEKKESQEICFVPQDYRTYLREHLKDMKPGRIVDKQGQVLGEHCGIACYTIGQRQGLGISGAQPLYIIDISAKDNRITVGAKADAFGKEFLVKSPHFVSGAMPKKDVAAAVKIRYNHKESQAIISPYSRKLKVRLSRPQFAITCGQSAVFYQGQKVLGGGVIEK